SIPPDDQVLRDNALGYRQNDFISVADIYGKNRENLQVVSSRAEEG
ncbi:unnamed protein product, partial [marine sediment metagenome]